MTTSQLRSLTLGSITAECPVALVAETAEGRFDLEIVSFAFERTYTQSEPKTLVAERLVLHAADGCTFRTPPRRLNFAACGT